MTSFDTSSKDAPREITFYCPELGEHNKNKLLITPSMTWDNTIGSIKNDLRKALDGADSEIWPLDINGEPFYDCENKLYNFDAIKKGEHLIISLKNSRRIRSEIDLEVVLFLEAEEGAGLQKALNKLDPVSRRDYLMRLRRRDGINRINICRIVLPHSEIPVKAKLTALGKANAATFQRWYSVAKSTTTIKDNWHARPNFKANYKVSQKCMAYIAILSEALCGQHLLGEDFIWDAVWARIEAGGEEETQDLQEQDILDAIQNLYEAADAIDSVWGNNKANIKGKGRKQAYKARKQMEEATALGNAAREAMGEEAAEAAYVGKGKGKAVDDDLAGRLQKTTVPDNTMAEDDSENSEPAHPPGRMRPG